MLTLQDAGVRLCDGLSRRDVLRAGGLGLFGLSLPQLLQVQATASTPKPVSNFVGGFGKAKSCIVLFLLGGPPQHETWDPKPDAPSGMRGEFKPIATCVPGLQIGELMPHTARLADKVSVLRAMSTNDNAHSSSGYWMLTGNAHQPTNFENAKPGAPNDWPCLGAVVRHLKDGQAALPSAITLPHRIFNTGNLPWPGQDAGFLGRASDPWLFNCDPMADDAGSADFRPAPEISPVRLGRRRSLMEQVNRRLEAVDRSGAFARFDTHTQKAFDLLRSRRAGLAFDLEREPAAVRDRYGRNPFGQSVLLARRLVQAGVSLIQVNWFRSQDEPNDNPCWDTHTNNAERLKTALMPPMDRAYAALLDDISQRGMLDETLIVWMGEFGRTPKINPRGGRDHWGHVFSVALAGGGTRGGQVHGVSDRVGGHPKDGRVQPQDLSATIFHCLGVRPDTELHDILGRPVPISRGEVIRQIL